MIFRLSLCLALSLIASPAALRTTTAVFISEEADYDEDGLDDEMEELLGTNPYDPDTDGDGWDDMTEILMRTDPNDAEDYPGQFTTAADTASSGNAAASQKRLELLTAKRGTVGTPASPTPPRDTNFNISVNYYYLRGNLPNLAIETRRNDLKAGSFLLLWRQHVRWNPLEIEQRYTVAIRTDDGRTIAEWHTPVPVETAWRYVGLPFSLKPSDEGRALTLSLIPEEEGQLEYSLAEFGALPAGLEADVDRDGAIGANERPPAGKPLRHWINDDDDVDAFDPEEEAQRVEAADGLREPAR